MFILFNSVKGVKKSAILKYMGLPVSSLQILILLIKHFNNDHILFALFDRRYDRYKCRLELIGTREFLNCFPYLNHSEKFETSNESLLKHLMNLLN